MARIRFDLCHLCNLRPVFVFRTVCASSASAHSTHAIFHSTAVTSQSKIYSFPRPLRDTPAGSLQSIAFAQPLAQSSYRAKRTTLQYRSRPGTYPQIRDLHHATPVDPETYQAP